MKQQIDQLRGMPDSRLLCLDINWRQNLSFADVIIFYQYFGLTRTANFVTVVDPWVYTEDKINSTIGVLRFVQTALAKAKLVGLEFLAFTDASMSSFLLSPILENERPTLVRIRKAKAAAPLQIPVACVPVFPPTITPASANRFSCSAPFGCKGRGVGGESAALHRFTGLLRACILRVLCCQGIS
jgi:hypothetical protein